MIEIKIDHKGLVEWLKHLQERAKELFPAMKNIAEIRRTAVMKKFEKGGRPTCKPCKRHSYFSSLFIGMKTVITTLQRPI